MEVMVKNAVIVYLLIAGLAFSGCTSTIQGNNRLEGLTDEEIEAYNSDPSNTDKIVCTEEAPIGSRIPKRVCRKESAIDSRSRMDQQALEKIQAGSPPHTNK